jgi:hypothetical protein
MDLMGLIWVCEIFALHCFKIELNITFFKIMNIQVPLIAVDRLETKTNGIILLMSSVELLIVKAWVGR